MAFLVAVGSGELEDGEGHFPGVVGWWLPVVSRCLSWRRRPNATHNLPPTTNRSFIRSPLCNLNHRVGQKFAACFVQLAANRFRVSPFSSISRYLPTCTALMPCSPSVRGRFGQLFPADRQRLFRGDDDFGFHVNRTPAKGSRRMLGKGATNASYFWHAVARGGTARPCATP